MTAEPAARTPLRGGEVPLPPGVPEDVFLTAVGVFLDRRRLDMRELASELGISRATLYRRAGDRGRLLGEVVWWLTEHALARSWAAGRGLTGQERVLAVIEAFMLTVRDDLALRRFLECEPECALRTLTAGDGAVHRGMVAATERLLAEEEATGALALPMDRATLAFLLVRVGEGFLYSDVIADRKLDNDVSRGVAVMRSLLGGGGPGSPGGA